MKVTLTQNVPLIFDAKSHTSFIVKASTHKKLSANQFLAYIKEYKPPLEMIPDVECQFETRTGNWLSRVLCNRFFFRRYTSSDIVRILEFVLDNYVVDTNKPDAFGSPLILYAIQSGFRDVVECLLASGARMTVNGRGVYNKIYTGQHIDIRSCMRDTDVTFDEYIHRKVYEEVVYGRAFVRHAYSSRTTK